MLGVTRSTTASPLVSTQESYEAYFGLGHVLELVDRPGVFKVSPAGLALGDYLVRSVDPRTVRGPALDMATGSGALALLLRSMGVASITATDVSAPAVKAAAENELLNFPDNRIAFRETSLFDGLAHDGPFDLIAFNPPGWRTPSDACCRALEQTGISTLDLSAMFGGEKVLLGFLLDLPRHLTESGRAVVGLNSLTGIRGVLAEFAHRSSGSGSGSGFGSGSDSGERALEFRLIERHSFPLFFYTQDWQASREILLAEFQRWRKEAGAVFSIAADGTLYWSYEIVECRLSRGLGGTGARTARPV